MLAGLASGLAEVEMQWSVLDLVEANLLLDYQDAMREKADRERSH
ncbi:MAG: hypothetical protein V2A73_16055 [Pseudomonadota bacterium]